MLFGADHAFEVTAIPGWVLDNQSGVRQGLHMVFYPRGETWSSSPVIVYGRVAEAMSVKRQVERTVEGFRKNGSPQYLGEAQKSLMLPNGRQVEIYYFSGDQWGNYEAAAYFPETNTMNFLVFNARTKEKFDESIGDFLKIASSYENRYADFSILSKEQSEYLAKEALFISTQPEGREYDSKALNSVGQRVANAMRECSAYVSNPKEQTFEYFARIHRDGKIAAAYLFPDHTLGVCFAGLMSKAEYPKHDLESFVFHLKMQTTP